MSRPIFRPARAQLGEDGSGVLVQLEVLVQLPAARDVDGAGVRRRLLAAHAEHDPLGEREPDLVVVIELRVPLEQFESAASRAAVKRDGSSVRPWRSPAAT